MGPGSTCGASSAYNCPSSMATVSPGLLLWMPSDSQGLLFRAHSEVLTWTLRKKKTVSPRRGVMSPSENPRAAFREPQRKGLPHLFFSCIHMAQILPHLPKTLFSASTQVPWAQSYYQLRSQHQPSSSLSFTAPSRKGKSRDRKRTVSPPLP